MCGSLVRKALEEGTHPGRGRVGVVSDVPLLSPSGLRPQQGLVRALLLLLHLQRQVNAQVSLPSAPASPATSA